MKVFVWTVLTVFLVSSLSAQQANGNRTAGSPAASVPAPAPIPDEKTLVISDAGTGQPTTTGPSPQTSGDLTFWDFLRMFLILAAVIGLIIGFIYLLRRFSGQNAQADSPIKVLYTHVLAGSRVLYLVEIGTEVLLLGTGDAGVQLLKEVTDQETIDQIRLISSRQNTSILKGNFGTLLGQILGKKDPILPKMNEPVDNSSEFLKKQRERLKNL